MSLSAAKQNLTFSHLFFVLCQETIYFIVVDRFYDYTSDNSQGLNPEIYDPTQQMKLILDIVCNHRNPDISGTKGELYDDGVKIADFNDDKNH